MLNADISSFFEILTSWQVIAVSLVIMILFPVIFYLASLDKHSAEFKKVPLKKEKKKIENTRSSAKDKIKNSEANESDI